MAISDFADMMPDTVTHEEFASRDSYGVKVYGSPEPYSARVVRKSKLMRDSEGNEIVAKGIVWFLGAPTVGTEDRITLPDSSTPPILDSETYPDENGDFFTKVIFG